MTLADLSKQQCEKVLELVRKEHLKIKDFDKRWEIEKILVTFEKHIERVWSKEK